MANIEIRQEFISGIHEIFSTMFNESSTPDDGVLFFPFLSGCDSVYQESKVKKYSSPITLICNVKETFGNGSTEVEAQKRSAVFTVPLKSLNDNGIEEMSKSMIAEMKKGLMKYKDTYYLVDLIQGRIFVENTYMLWDFKCTEIFDDSEIIDGYILIVASEENLGGIKIGDTLNISEDGTLYSEALTNFKNDLYVAEKVCK